MATLGSCSEDKPRRSDSELLVDPPVAPVADGTTAPEEVSDATVTAASQRLTGAGRRYQVAVGTAYFFDSPQQSTPNGRYLRRGDVFYGEGELNGFVKTGFVTPNGVKSTGWLKVRELARISAGSAPETAPRGGAANPPAAAANATANDARATPEAPLQPVPTVSSNARTAVVQVDRSYFYNTPDLTAPRKAHCVRGDKVRLGETRGEAVYVTFTNWENVTSTGWMRRDALR
ncbi:hypothetical protein I2I05_11010 [Hymenobacter sp. BT683]|uniref:SH3 domain-containing protein n=1 Tax=Hymenobacter jeongseonensis TaxID=2791027 RepID=A0ABS0IHT5_9BACT|nr:hypothetical protein [Hymenobacter jeongseonensis]MBF9237924.1 hypothetical protein [Hymenobacter jeongseonensis]